MPFQVASTSRGRDVQIEFLDRTRLTDEHDWDIVLQTNISFRYVVEENIQPRSDTVRFKLIASLNLEGAKVAFSKVCASPTLYRIPDTIPCDRTFARDAEEACYVDAMHKFLHEDLQELRVEDLPILKVRLDSRFYCSFAKKPVYLTELYERKRTGFWTPGDSPDLDFFSDLEITAMFPNGGAWKFLIEQPTTLTIPLPFSVYLYHLTLREAERLPTLENSALVLRLRFCMEKEYYILFIATWWIELFHGGKAFVLKHQTIDILDNHCGSIPNIAGKPAQAIIDRMRTFADMPSSYHNSMCFPDRSMEQSTFIFAVRKLGVHDESISSQRTLWCRRDRRSITVKRNSTTVYKRVALLDGRLSDPDLDDIPGLLGLVRSQEWANHNSLRVGDLIINLMSLYDNTRGYLSQAHRQLVSEEHAHDNTKKELDILSEKMNTAIRDGDGDRQYIGNLEQKLEHGNRRLDDAHCHIDAIRAELNECRRQQRGNRRQSEVLRSTWLRQNPNGSGNESPRSPHYSPPQQRLEANAQEKSVALPNTDVRLLAAEMDRDNPTTNKRSLPETQSKAVSTPAQESAKHVHIPLWKTRADPSRPAVGYPFWEMPPKTTPTPPQVGNDVAKSGKSTYKSSC